METVTLTVHELYTVKSLLEGLTIHEEGKEPKLIVQGLIHEKGVPETIKRAANKALRAVVEDLTPITQQRAEISSTVYADTTEEDLPARRREEDQKLLADTVSLQIEKLDFSKIADLSLSTDYTLLYDKLFN